MQGGGGDSRLKWLHFRNRSYVHVLPICTQLKQISIISTTIGTDKDTVRFHTWGSNCKPEWDILLLKSLFIQGRVSQSANVPSKHRPVSHTWELLRTATVFNKQCYFMLLELNCLAEGLSIIQSDSLDFSQPPLNHKCLSHKANRSARWWQACNIEVFLPPPLPVGPHLAAYTKLMSSPSARWVTSGCFIFNIISYAAITGLWLWA